MANPRVVPEDEALPGDKIADVIVREPRANLDALAIDKHVVKLGPARDAVLCLQGGALRSVYTAGVLDAFLDRGLAFSQVVGVSGGTLVGLDYVCGARGEAAYANLVYAGDPRYMGLRDLVRLHQIFNFDFMFGELSERLMPFDFDRFSASPMRLAAVASRVADGSPVYFDLTRAGLSREEMAARASASCSMPLLSKPIVIDGEAYLDGGVTDPLGLGVAREAVAHGRKVVIVTTRERGFSKPPEPARKKRLYRRAFARHPAFAERLCQMRQLTNDQLDEADVLAARGEAFVVHPVTPPAVTHTEKDTGKLRALYEQGVFEGGACLPALLAYLDG